MAEEARGEFGGRERTGQTGREGQRKMTTSRHITGRNQQRPPMSVRGLYKTPPTPRLSSSVIPRVLSASALHPQQIPATMARSLQAVLFLAAALSFFSFQASVHADPHFFVEGQVYCDTCRVQFVTKVSEFMAGAKVRMECRDREGGSVTYSIEGETDNSGSYKLPVEGEHEEEVCEVQLIKSTRDDCSEISQGGFSRRSARISLASHNGMATADRLANPLGFMKHEALPQCPEVLKELGILPTGLI